MAETQTKQPKGAAAAAPAAPRQPGTYEAMFLFGSGAAQDVEGAIRTTRGVIERHGGTILVIKKWDERKLAYEINGQKRGVYVIAYFTAPGAAVTAIERDVKLSEEILRVMVTKADHLNPEEMAAVEPQPIEKREERAPWDRPYGDRGGFDRGDRGGDRGFDRGPREPREPREPRGEEGGGGGPGGGGDRGGERGGDRPQVGPGGGVTAREPRAPRPPRREEPGEGGAGGPGKQ